MNTNLRIHEVTSARVTRNAFSVAKGHSSDFDTLDICIVSSDGQEMTLTLFVASGQVLEGIRDADFGAACRTVHQR